MLTLAQPAKTAALLQFIGKQNNTEHKETSSLSLCHKKYSYHIIRFSFLGS